MKLDQSSLATKMMASWQLELLKNKTEVPETVSVEMFFWVVAGYELEKRKQGDAE